MKQPNRFVKAIVLATSMLLVTVFVLHRAGALNTFTSDAPETSSEVKPTATSIGVAHVPDTPATKEPVDSPVKDTVRRSRFFGGSKSGVPMIDASASDTPRTTTDTAMVVEDTPVERREVFMGGSKSLAPMIETRGSQIDEDVAVDTIKKSNKR